MATRRRWLQFSLRGFLVAITVGCIWLGREVNKAAKQKRMVASIQAFYGDVRYDFDQSQIRRPSEGPSIDAWMRKTFGRDFLHDVVEVNFACRTNDRHQDWNYAHMDDDVVPLVVGLSRLRKLTLHYGQATDESFKILATMTSLEEINVGPASLVTDKGLEFIKRLPNLKTLSVYEAPLTDKSLAAVSELPSLERLTLCNSAGIGGKARFTDEGIMALAKCANLRELVVRQTGVSEPGAAALKARLPNCSINAKWNGPWKLRDGRRVPDVNLADKL